MNPVAAAEEANRIMVLVDKNNSGSIDYTEFVVATMNRENMLSKQKLDTAFKMFDKVNITCDDKNLIILGWKWIYFFR